MSNLPSQGSPKSFEDARLSQLTLEQIYAQLSILMSSRQERLKPTEPPLTPQVEKEKEILTAISSKIVQTTLNDHPTFFFDVLQVRRDRFEFLLFGLLTLNRRILKLFCNVNGVLSDVKMVAEEKLLITFLENWFRQRFSATTLPTSPVIDESDSKLDNHLQLLFFRYLFFQQGNTQIGTSQRARRKLGNKVILKKLDALGCELAVGLLQRHYKTLKQDKFKEIFETDSRQTFLAFLTKISLQQFKGTYSRWKAICNTHGEAISLFPWETGLKGKLSRNFANVLFQTRQSNSKSFIDDVNV
ncbi:hypothetical protein O181_035724 [Austropuccinia psidii MF-1]|uniref:Uncharacterized protein n=1 Tax=Austropuccinia psidii MF-1 TaxID=1389203 RepID=A0A9Q3D372_9BASI|nr:hypothetical protein [Austropuccinia psidii MF-1]